MPWANLGSQFPVPHGSREPPTAALAELGHFADLPLEQLPVGRLLDGAPPRQLKPWAIKPRGSSSARRIARLGEGAPRAWPWGEGAA
jgi:hypothetical protein